MSISQPPCCKMIDQSPTRSSARESLSLDEVARGSILKRIVPGNKRGSCNTVLIRERTSSCRTVEILSPSRVILPAFKSIIDRRQSSRDVLPLPERPQIATCSPDGIDKETFFSTGSLLSLGIIINQAIHHTSLKRTHSYEATTPSNLRAPTCDHSSGT